MINRRTLLTTALTLGAMKAFPGLSYAQARPLVFATFTGSWEEAHKAVLVPAFRKANADASIVLDPMLSVDQIAKVNAARANPPIDVMLHDPGPALVAIGQDIVEPFPVEKSTHYKDLIAEAQEPMGPAPFFQVVGLTYNPDTIKTPPTSWADLWDPKWKGRVGLVDILFPNNTIMAALAGGGSMSNYDPAEKKLMELRSLDAKIYPSNEALAAALKSEEVWLTSMWLARGFMWKKAGIPLSHVVPKEGAVSIVFEASIPRNARNKDGGYTYLDAMLDPKAQVAFADKMGYVPTVSDAVLPEDIAKQVSLSESDRARLLKPDYKYHTERMQRTLDFWNKEFKG